MWLETIGVVVFYVIALLAILKFAKAGADNERID